MVHGVATAVGWGHPRAVGCGGMSPEPIGDKYFAQAKEPRPRQQHSDLEQHVCLDENNSRFSRSRVKLILWTLC